MPEKFKYKPNRIHKLATAREYTAGPPEEALIRRRQRNISSLQDQLIEANARLAAAQALGEGFEDKVAEIQDEITALQAKLAELTG